MHTQASVYASAAEAYENAEFGRRPLWRGGPTIAAAVVGVGLLDFEQLGRDKLADTRTHLQRDV